MDVKKINFDKILENPLKLKDNYGGELQVEPSHGNYFDNLFSEEKLFFKTDLDGIVLTKKQWELIKVRVDEILE